MSYDLYFYKKKHSELSEINLREHLNDNLFEIPTIENSWYYNNKYTEAYFYFEIRNDIEENILEDFEPTNLWFNLNYLRLEYFGIIAFNYVMKLVVDLDLCVMNPQIETKHPYKPNNEELFENWKALNKQSTIKYAKEYGLIYCPIEKSNWLYEYNSLIPKAEKTFDYICYVPRIMLMKEKSSNKIISIVTWSMNIPNMFPETDYICLFKEKKGFFRTKKYLEVITFESFLKEFNEFLTQTTHDKVTYIDESKFSYTKEKFFNMKTLGRLVDILEHIEIEKLTNYEIK